MEEEVGQERRSRQHGGWAYAICMLDCIEQWYRFEYEGEAGGGGGDRLVSIEGGGAGRVSRHALCFLQGANAACLHGRSEPGEESGSTFRRNPELHTAAAI